MKPCIEVGLFHVLKNPNFGSTIGQGLYQILLKAFRKKSTKYQVSRRNSYHRYPQLMNIQCKGCQGYHFSHT